MDLLVVMKCFLKIRKLVGMEGGEMLDVGNGGGLL